MLRRPPTGRETTWAVLVVVAVTLVSIYAALYWTDWQLAPVRSGLAVGLMIVGGTTLYLRRPAERVLDQIEHENTTGEVPATR